MPNSDPLDSVLNQFELTRSAAPSATPEADPLDSVLDQFDVPSSSTASGPRVHSGITSFGNLPPAFRSAAEEDQLRELDAMSALRGAERQAMVNRVPRAGDIPANPLSTSTAQEVPATIADKTTRMKLAGDLALAGRIGLEGGSTALGVAAGGPIGAAVKRPVLRAGAKALATAAGATAGTLAAEVIDPSEDPIANAKMVAGFSLLGDGFAQTLGAVASRVARGGTELTPGARRAMRLAGPGFSPSAGRLSENTSVDIFENFIENSFGSAGVISKKNKRSSMRLQQKLGDYIKTFTGGATREEIDNLVTDIASNRHEAFKLSAESIYSKVDEIAPVGVETASLIALRNKLVSEATAAHGTGMSDVIAAIDRTLGVEPSKAGLSRGIKISSDPVIFKGELIEKPSARSSISFRDAQTLRSDLLGMARSNADPFGSKAEAWSKLTSKATDSAMEAAGLALDNPEAFEYWRMGNQFWKDGADAFGSTVMRTLANTKPDELFTTIMQAGHPQQIKAFRKLVLGGTGLEDGDTAKKIIAASNRTLSDPSASSISKEIAQRRLDGIKDGEEAWNKFVGQFMHNISTGADPGAAILSEGAKGSRELVGSTALERFNSFGDETLREIFPKQSKRRLAEDFFRAIEIAQAGTGLGIGTFQTQFIQAGLVWEFLTKGSLKAASILLSTPMLGKLAQNEKFIRWATIGSKAKPGSKLALRASTQMALIAAKEGARVRDSQGNDVNIGGFRSKLVRDARAAADARENANR